MTADILALWEVVADILGKFQSTVLHRVSSKIVLRKAEKRKEAFSASLHHDSRFLQSRCPILSASCPNASSVVLATLLEMRGAMLFATLICLLAVLPVFSMQGTAGAFFRPLAVTYVLAVFASTFVAAYPATT